MNDTAPAAITNNAPPNAAPGLRACGICAGAVSPKARTCPHCGHPFEANRPKESMTGTGWWGLMLIVAGVALMMLTFSLPSNPAQDSMLVFASSLTTVGFFLMALGAILGAIRALR